MSNEAITLNGNELAATWRMQNVRDKATGVQLAWIEDGKVFDAKTRAMVGIIRNGKVFRLNGVFVCHVASLRETGETPDAFKRLLEEEED